MMLTFVKIRAHERASSSSHHIIGGGGLGHPLRFLLRFDLAQKLFQARNDLFRGVLIQVDVNPAQYLHKRGWQRRRNELKIITSTLSSSHWILAWRVSTSALTSSLTRAFKSSSVVCIQSNSEMLDALPGTLSKISLQVTILHNLFSSLFISLSKINILITQRGKE